jgi:hypothetical protein
MKIALTILVNLVSLTIGFATAKLVSAQTDSMIKVLVLPAYDPIVNAGASPEIRTILESALTGKSGIAIISFPFKKLMNVPYQMVYDKKYCKSITEKVDCDIIVMSQLITDNEHRSGIGPWAYKIRIYNVRTDQQVNSIRAENLKAGDFERDIGQKISALIKDIEVTFKTR